jgi:hypothetical protein
MMLRDPSVWFDTTRTSSGGGSGGKGSAQPVRSWMAKTDWKRRRRI